MGFVESFVTWVILVFFGLGVVYLLGSVFMAVRKPEWRLSVMSACAILLLTVLDAVVASYYRMFPRDATIPMVVTSLTALTGSLLVIVAHGRMRRPSGEERT